MGTMNPSDPLLDTLSALLGWLEALQTPHTIVGGVATGLLGAPRVTQDIDAVIWLENERWRTFLEKGAEYGFAARISDALTFAQRSRVFLLEHADYKVGVDISCGALPFEQEMIERSQTIGAGGLKVKVPTVEDLIVMKLVALRPKDIADIEGLLAVHRTLDFEHMRRWTLEFAEVLDRPEMVETFIRLVSGTRKKF